jgi:predicted CoA-substrate-specific enzyme activase
MTEAPLYLGLDVGSTTVKAAAVDADGAIVAHAIARASGDYTADIARVRADVARVGAPFAAIVATGYGQALVDDASRTISEISCHARGARALHPNTRVVIDIGGQDMKVISVNERGKPSDFLMNDKCAAGTGRFLEVTARALGLEIGELSALAVSSAAPARINSMCTVFAESEVISLLARGATKTDVAAGLVESIAERIAGMVRKLGVDLKTESRNSANSESTDPVQRPVLGASSSDGCMPILVMTGGGALNPALVESVSRRLACPIAVPPHAQLAGALGAALFARDGAG